MKPNIRSLIAQLEQIALLWNDVTVGVHAMGGKEFLYRSKEIGHIHWNGDLDILFGKPLTAELLKHNLVKQHQYVPAAAITFPVLREEDLPFAASLLRFSYLIHAKKATADNEQLTSEVNGELGKLSFYPLVEHLI